MKNTITSLAIICMLVSVSTTALAVKPETQANTSSLTSIPVNAEPLVQPLCDYGICFVAYDPSGVYDQGIIKFDSTWNIIQSYPWSPGSYGFCTGAAWNGEVDFMSTYDTSSSDLYSIDFETLEPTFVGSIGYSVHAMTYDCTTGTIYAAGGAGNAANLYTIDPETAEATLVGSFGGGLAYVLSLACDPDGNMYCIDISTDMFYSVNKETGHATQIGSVGLALNYAQDMCFDGYTLYLFTFEGIYIIDPETGQATLSGQFLGGTEIDALAFINFVEPIPPTTSLTLDGTIVDGAYISPVTAILTAVPGGAPINHTYIKIDDGNWMIYSAPVSVATAGNHTIQYYSDDIAGLIEDVQTATFTIRSPISITIKGGLGFTVTITNNGPVTLNVTWSIEINGMAFPNQWNGTATLPPGDSFTTKAVIIGFGPARITVTANESQKQASGMVLLFFVLGVK